MTNGDKIRRVMAQDRGVAGEIYPCKKDIFGKTYEEAKADGGNAECG